MNELNFSINSSKQFTHCNKMKRILASQDSIKVSVNALEQKKPLMVQLPSFNAKLFNY